MSEADIRAYAVRCPVCLAPVEHALEPSGDESSDVVNYCPCGTNYTRTDAWKAYRRRCWERDGSKREPSPRWPKAPMFHVPHKRETA